MNYQRSKAPLSLMEQLIMVFVFAFAAAICLQAFVYSDRLSKDGTAKETASVRATEVIEIVKAYHGDLDKAAGKLGASVSDSDGQGGGSLEKEFTDDGLKVTLKTDDPTQTAGKELHRTAKVSVVEIPQDGAEAKEPIYSVDVAWQTEPQLLK